MSWTGKATAPSLICINMMSNAGAEEVGEQVLRKQLNPGDLMIFEDSRFKHGATPLIPPPGGRAKRDVLVCTVDLPTTYLQRHPVS